MIVAFSKTFPQGIQVDGLGNRGGWWGKTWLILVGTGFDPARFVVEADNEADAVDELVDSRWGFHLTQDVDPCQVCQAHQAGQRVVDFSECSCVFGGNYGVLIDSERIAVLERCQVNYFAPKDFFERSSP